MWVRVDEQDASFRDSKAGGQIDGCCSFTHPAFLVSHRNNFCHSESSLITAASLSGDKLSHFVWSDYNFRFQQTIYRSRHVFHVSHLLDVTRETLKIKVN